MLHLAEQRVHFRDAERAVRAHRGVAGHRGEQLVLARGQNLACAELANLGEHAARETDDIAAGERDGRARRELVRPDTVSSRPRRSSVSRFSSAVATSSASAWKKRRYEQRLALHRSGVKVGFQLLHHDALVRRVHIHEDESGLVLRQDVDAMELRKRIAERRGFFGDGERRRGCP